MSKNGDYSVVRRRDGWAAVGHGDSRASSLHGGGKVPIHGRDGRIRDKNTVVAVHDSCNIKG